MPPATPRSFRRLFGPRSGGSGRQPLADVDASSLNQRCLATSAKTGNGLAATSGEPEPRTPSRKRKAPLEAGRGAAFTPKRSKQYKDTTFLSSSPGYPAYAANGSATRIRRSKVRYAFGAVLNREHGIASETTALRGSFRTSR